MARISIHPSALLFAVLTPLVLVTGCQPATSETQSATETQAQASPAPTSSFAEQVKSAPDCHDLAGPWQSDLERTTNAQMDTVTTTYTFQDSMTQHLTCTLDAGIPHEAGTIWKDDLPEGATLLLTREGQALIYIDTDVEPGTTFTLTATNGPA